MDDLEAAIRQIEEQVLVSHAVPTSVVGDMPTCRRCGTSWVQFIPRSTSRVTLTPGCACHLEMVHA